MGKEGKAEGACMRATLKFLGKQVQIFGELANRPAHHDEVADFVARLLELERISGWSLADIGTDCEQLEIMVLNAFNNTSYALAGHSSVAPVAQKTAAAVQELKQKAQKALAIFGRSHNAVSA